MKASFLLGWRGAAASEQQHPGSNIMLRRSHDRDLQNRSCAALRQQHVARVAQIEHRSHNFPKLPQQGMLLTSMRRGTILLVGVAILLGSPSHSAMNNAALNITSMFNRYEQQVGSLLQKIQGKPVLLQPPLSSCFRSIY